MLIYLHNIHITIKVAPLLQDSNIKYCGHYSSSQSQSSTTTALNSHGKKQTNKKTFKQSTMFFFTAQKPNRPPIKDTVETRPKGAKTSTTVQKHSKQFPQHNLGKDRYLPRLEH